MNVNELAAADAAFLLHELGEDVVRWPLGEQGLAATVRAIVGLGERRVDEDRGRGYVVPVDLTVAADLEIDPRDAWIIGGTRMEMEAVGEPAAGLKTILLMRRTSESTTHRSFSQRGR